MRHSAQLHKIRTERERERTRYFVRFHIFITGLYTHKRTHVTQYSTQAIECAAQSFIFLISLRSVSLRLEHVKWKIHLAKRYAHTHTHCAQFLAFIPSFLFPALATMMCVCVCVHAVACCADDYLIPATSTGNGKYITSSENIFIKSNGISLMLRKSFT